MGTSPTDFIRADSVEQDILTQAAERAQDIRFDWMRVQAQMTIEELGKALKKKK